MRDFLKFDALGLRDRLDNFGVRYAGLALSFRAGVAVQTRQLWGGTELRPSQLVRPNRLVSRRLEIRLEMWLEIRLETLHNIR